MKLKKDGNFEQVANRANKDPKEVEAILLQGLQDFEVEDSELCWGQRVSELINPLISEVCELLHKAGIASVNDRVYDAFCGLTVMGDGDCEECGGQLELHECEGHEVFISYEQPPEFVVEHESWICPVCGKIVNII